MSTVIHTNRLINEKSPYLLQHAHNPVDWYPWGNEAFEKAKTEDKPVFLSIGYSTCHWCHVMERESFEDEEVAALLNRHFVSIKVDREERPDVDDFYMNACVAQNGSGGWPLSCFLTSDRRAFFTGTYFPKADPYGGAGFLSILSQISALWRTQRQELERSAETLLHHLDRPSRKGTLKLGVEQLAYGRLSQDFDGRYGGFGGAPKFPSLQNILFLLRYGALHPESEAFAMVRKTLDGMAEGGIRDHVGGGFCRYSTDEKWLIPHFEKMMLDNALFILVYSEAGALFGGRYADVARQATDFCLREMLDPSGGFYTALDADSEGAEGRFYVFTPQEVMNALGYSEGVRCCELYHITPQGNFEGKNVPNLIGTTLSEEDRAFAARCNENLLRYRTRRVPPFKDDKCLTLVNGLMIVALSVEARLLGRPELIDVAQRCAGFVLDELVRDGRLRGGWRAGQAGAPATSDDYAALIWGLLELYEATLSPQWLACAVDFIGRLDALFWDTDAGGYFIAGSDVRDLPVRAKSMYDGAHFSGNSMMAMNLLRLARLCGEPRYEDAARQVTEAMAATLNTYPTAGCGALCALLHMQHGGTEIILTGGEGFEALREETRRYQPFAVTAACGPGYEAVLETAPFMAEYGPVNGRAAAYVCSHGVCRTPVASPLELAALLDKI